MNLVGATILMVGLLPALGFAWRGIALLRMKEVTPRRFISVSGVVAMVSMWVFAGMAPLIASSLVEIFQEFELEVPLTSDLAIAILMQCHELGWLWYPFVFLLSLCVLLVPEILVCRRA